MTEKNVNLPSLEPAGVGTRLPSPEFMLKMLRALKLTRQLEDRIENKLYRQGKIVGGVYTSRGQEAISVGSALAFADSDVVCPSHRDMGVYLLRGMTPERILAHYLGRQLGPSHGKDGNIHTGDLDLGVVAFVSHLGDTIPVAAGLGLSAKIQKTDRVAGVFFGDGGSSRGDFHEGLNLAAVLKLPVVFICNNNQYAYSTPLSRSMAVPGVAERALGYGFPTHSVDGNDVLEVYRAVRAAVTRAREGGGPTLIEGRSFRMTGHSAHDDASYVPRQFFEEWAKKDPIKRLESTLIEHRVLSPDGVRDLEVEIDEQIDQALAVAEASPLPVPEEALTDVFADSPTHAAVPLWRPGAASIDSIERLQPAPLEPVATLTEMADQAASARSGASNRDQGTTYVDAIRQAMLEEMDADPRVFLLGEDIGVYGGAFKATRGLIERFGEDRVIDTPIAESGIVGAAIGASFDGMRPIVEIQFIDFISCAFDQLTSFAAKSRYRWGAAVPIVVRGPCGGGVSGGPFHSQNVESFFTNTPGLKIVTPSTARDARGLLKSAVRDDDPVLFFEHKYLYRRVREEIPADDGAVPIGKAVRRRAGSDLSIITYSATVFTALTAAEELAREGIEAEVLDLRTLKPLDVDAVLESVARTNRALIVHEASLTGGFGGEIAGIIAERAFEYLDAPVRRIAGLDTPVPFSPQLEAYFLPQPADIVRTAREICEY